MKSLAELALSAAHWAAWLPASLIPFQASESFSERAVPSLLEEVGCRLPCANDLAWYVRFPKIRNPPADGIADDLPGLVAEEHADRAAQDATDGNPDRAADCAGHRPQLRAGEHAADTAGESARTAFPAFSSFWRLVSESSVSLL